jgi:hypothetical protein
MRASVNPARSDQSAGMISAPSVKIDLSNLRTPPASWTDHLRFTAIVALCLGLHIALVLMLEPQPQPQMAPGEEAIPIEVIVEPPPEEASPEPPKAEEPPAEQQAQPLLEQPATDFARTADQDREDGKASEQPPAETSEREAIQPEKSAAAESEPTPPEPVAPTEPAPAVKPAPGFAGLTPLPDFQFSEPAKQQQARRSDLPGGTAEPGYLSTLYGLILR